MKMTMTRTVNERERWYRLEVSENLFGEWILTRSYGSLYRSLPIGEMMEVFASKASAYAAYNRINKLKTKKGYSLVSNITDKNPMNAP